MIETSLQHDEPVAIPARSFGKQVRSMAGYTIVTALMFVSPLLASFRRRCSIAESATDGARRGLLLVLSAVVAALLLYPVAASAKPVEMTTIYGTLLGSSSPSACRLWPSCRWWSAARSSAACCSPR